MPLETLSKIPSQKRQRILLEAAKLFASRGYNHTDMAELANRAAVAKGSLYNYFESKEELYRYVCLHGLELSRQAVYGQLDEHWDIYQKIDHIFRYGVRFAKQHPEYVAMYLNVASAGMERFAEALSAQVEKFTAATLKAAIAQGQRDGLVRKDLDVKFAAFQINSLYIIFLASLVSRHFQIRMAEYFEVPADSNASVVDQHLERAIGFIHDFLRPSGMSPEGANHN